MGFILSRECFERLYRTLDKYGFDNDKIEFSVIQDDDEYNTVIGYSVSIYCDDVDEDGFEYKYWEIFGISAKSAEDAVDRFLNNINKYVLEDCKERLNK